MNYISYERFGVNFVNHAVTPERVKAAVMDTAGRPLQIGPMPAGPGGIAIVTASGHIGMAEVEKLEGHDVAFTARLPIELELEVKLAGIPQKYKGEIEVRLSLTVRTAEPLWLLIEVAEVTGDDVTVSLQPEGVTAEFLQRAGNMDAEVRSQVVRMVNERIDSEKARSTREIDVAALMERAMSED